jgi:hypothetical protein
MNFCKTSAVSVPSHGTDCLDTESVTEEKRADAAEMSVLRSVRRYGREHKKQTKR